MSTAVHERLTAGGEPRLSTLIERLAAHGQLRGELRQGSEMADPPIGRVRYDSRKVAPGDLFVARPGQHADGHDHIPGAVAAGAAAVVCERPLPTLAVPQVPVHDARTSLALAAAWRAGDPSHRLGVVGITGTDGKTTTAYLVRAILEAAGLRTGFVGTTDVIVAGSELGNEARATTPEAPELQDYFARMAAGGDTFAVVEATSHGLAQRRVAAVAFDVAVLTNITSEHLEFHGSLEAYREAKRLLFRHLARGPGEPAKPWGKHAVVNADDAQASLMAATAQEAGARVLRYGLGGPLAGSRLAAPGRTAGRTTPGPTSARTTAAGTRSPEAGSPRTAAASGSSPQTVAPPDLVALDLVEGTSSMQVSVRSPSWQGVLTLRLAGRFNVHNALAALAVAEALGLDLADAAVALKGVAAVPGRMQRIDQGQPFTVVVDYAHTAEALATVLDELAPAGGGGLIAVFGSAGERDTQKRPAMGRVAGERCRLVVVTDEDPRGEDRLAILEAIAEGATAAGKRRGDDLLVIPDRREAIGAALGAARPGDVVLLAGKGHERTIEMAGEALPWDEAAAAREALRDLGF